MKSPLLSKRRTRQLGWALWLISVAFGGYTAVFAGFGVMLVWTATDLSGVVVGSALIIGFLANLALFFGLPRWLTALSIAAPWAAFAAWIFLQIGRPMSMPEKLVEFPFFYPWALGIALLQGARLSGDGETQHFRTLGLA